MLPAMPVSREFLDHVADQLSGFGPLAVRRMFGGAGLFRGALMFGFVSDDVLYFKVGDGNRAAYLATGAKHFTYRRLGATASLTSYYEVPAGVLDDAEMLVEWARGARAAAQAAATGARRSERKKEKEPPRARRSRRR